MKSARIKCRRNMRPASGPRAGRLQRRGPNLLRPAFHPVPWGWMRFSGRTGFVGPHGCAWRQPQAGSPEIFATFPRAKGLEHPPELRARFGLGSDGGRPACGKPPGAAGLDAADSTQKRKDGRALVKNIEVEQKTSMANLERRCEQRGASALGAVAIMVVAWTGPVAGQVTELVSVATGGAQTNSASYEPSVSADGRFPVDDHAVLVFRGWLPCGGWPRSLNSRGSGAARRSRQTANPRRASTPAMSSSTLTRRARDADADRRGQGQDGGRAQGDAVLRGRIDENGAISSPPQSPRGLAPRRLHCLWSPDGIARRNSLHLGEGPGRRVCRRCLGHDCLAIPNRGRLR